VKDKYDVVIVGSGIGGLVSAVLLSEAGRSVLVIEKEPGPGGYLAGFTIDGFAFEPSLHLLNGCSEGRYTYEILKQCKITDKIRFIKPKYLYRGIFPDFDIRVPQSDPDKYKSILIGLFPDSEHGIEELFSSTLKMFREITASDGVRTISPILMPYFRRTCGEVLGQYIKDEKLKAIIVQPWTYFGLPPSLLRAVDFFYPWYDYVCNGGYYVKRGGLGLVNELYDRAEANGATFVFNQKVDKVEVHDNYCKHVIFGSAKVSCGVLISGADLFSTVTDLIGAKHLPQTTLNKIKSIMPSISNFEIFLGLSTDLRNKYSDDYEILISSDYDPDSQYNASLSDDVKAAPFSITLYSNIDNSCTSGNKSMITINMLSGYDHWKIKSDEEYRGKKDEVADILIKRACKIIPEIEDNIQTKVVSTPTTFERYTNNYKGAIYGNNRSIGSLAEVRPGNSLKIKNLHFASAWARQGSGVEKVLHSAGEVVKRILNEQQEY